MSGIQVTPPTLQCQKELDTMLRNVTRDCDRVRTFISKEKNDLYRAELTKIFTATLQFAQKYDGCKQSVMGTVAFKKDALEMFTMISKQRRGGRKLLFVMLSSPTSGLDQQFASWWPTIRGMDSGAIKLMDSFLKRLSMEIAAEADISDATPPPTLNETDAEVLMKKKLVADVVKTVHEKFEQAAGFDGFSLATVGDGNEFTMTVTLIKRNDDSGVGDNLANVGDTSVKEAPVKVELPAPIIAHLPPKSEAARASTEDRPLDQDGFWIDSSDDENFVQVAMTPKGCFIIFYFSKFLIFWEHFY